MKTTLAIAALVLGSVAASAANVVFSTVINTSGITGHGLGSYSTTLSKGIFAGSITSSTSIDSGYLLEPDGITKIAFTIANNGSGNYGFRFSTQPAALPNTFLSNISSYVATFFHGSTKVASASVGLGNLTVVPETQTYALVAGAGLVGFAAFRRARR